VDEFMRAEKVVQEGIRWEHAPHTDTAKCALPVYVPSQPSFNSRLALAAHVSSVPSPTFATDFP